MSRKSTAIVEIQVGSKWQDAAGAFHRRAPFRVMAIAERWVMMRRKGCMVTCAHENDFGPGRKYKEAAP